MKAAFAVVAIGASIVAAQELASLPACGQTCIGNMLALAPSLGCDGADAACLCRTADFGYGVRDCANQACGDAAAAQQVIAYGAQYCSTALAAGGSSSGAGGASGTSASASQTEGPVSSGASAITTSALTALVSGTDSSFITTTGFTTIFDSSTGSAAEPTGTNSAGELTDSAGSVIASATESASAAMSSAMESATDALSSASEAFGSATSSAAAAASSATSEAGAAMMTAAPVLAAGVLALLAF